MAEAAANVDETEDLNTNESSLPAILSCNESLRVKPCLVHRSFEESSPCSTEVQCDADCPLPSALKHSSRISGRKFSGSRSPPPVDTLRHYRHSNLDSSTESLDVDSDAPCSQQPLDHCQSQTALAKEYTVLSSTSNKTSATSSLIALVVDNNRFLVETELLLAHPNTMLGRMMSSRLLRNSTTGSGDVRIGDGVSANVFKVLLGYYVDGVMRCPTHVPVNELKDACDYFMIPFNNKTVKCSNIRAFLHEVSNDGACELFEKCLEELILPEMVKCARAGERECHIVILLDDEIIDWDEDYPPQMAESELTYRILHNTKLLRFLKYIENRDVAKQVLIERGLKKIKIGIEGYPTYKEKVKKRPGYRPEVIYNYAQRPFLRMSWEEEENRSRHVDFQCVKTRSLSDLISLETVALERPVDLPPSTPAVADLMHLTRPDNSEQ